MPARAALADACLLGGNTVLEWHRALVASGRFSPDERQNEAALLLQKFADEIVAEAKTTRARANGGGGFFARVRDFVGGNQAAANKRAGLYLHGGVGRGKTVLMDGFFLQLPIVRKRRAHFHAFMRHFHEDIKTGRGEDPLSQVADRIADQNDILCFDEFHVSDIADAMILTRLLDRLLARGVRFVMTSNYAPQDLYPNGLARDRFLPAINLLRERFSVFGFAGGDDYRSRQLDAGGRYFFPDDDGAKKRFAQAWERIACGISLAPRVRVLGRDLPAVARASDAVWFTFADLCGGNRSQADYLRLAERFGIVFLAGVPRIADDRASDAARRFTWLIDILYDNRVSLIVQASAPLDDLFESGGESGRAQSRLREMQSAVYARSPFSA